MSARSPTVHNDEVRRCEPNAVLCEDNVLHYCDAEGQPVTEKPCGAKGCIDGASACRQCDPQTASVCDDGKIVGCDAHGQFEIVTCEHGCRDGASRCNACTPNAPDTCVGGDVEQCDGAGNSTIVTCGSVGCFDGRCCADDDLDGISDCHNDCDDSDPNVYKGQLEFFAGASPNVGFDYDCDGVETPRVTGVGCDVSRCDEGGWSSAVPACGEQGYYSRCRMRDGNCVRSSRFSFSTTQVCH